MHVNFLLISSRSFNELPSFTGSGENQSDRSANPLVSGSSSEINLLGLARRAHELFENQPANEKRKLLDFVLSNSIWKNGELVAEYRQPFDVLAFAVASDPPTRSAELKDVVENENWLPESDITRNRNWPALPESLYAIDLKTTSVKIETIKVG